VLEGFFLCLGLTLDCDFIHTWIIDGDGVLLTFLPGWP
jgi:hypothetical protein